MRYSTILDQETNNILVDHLIRSDGQEDLCFALWYPSKGMERYSAIIPEAILPKKADRNVHGNASFKGRYFSRVISEARRKNAGIAFLHSHPYPGWQRMSVPDVEAEKMLAPRVKAATGLPLIGLTIGSDGTWSSRFWVEKSDKHYNRKWCRDVRVFGEKLDLFFKEDEFNLPHLNEKLERTISAWGQQKQTLLSRLTIGIVGAGSVGSILGETLARMGLTNLKIIDFDLIEERNLDRSLHFYEKDIGFAKAEILTARLRKSTTIKDFNIEPIDRSICEEEGYQKALDCDIIFSCVDRPWPRQVLNSIAYFHFIPVIDGGIRVFPHFKDDKIKNIRGADWRAHVVGPNRPCLECLGQYTSGLVSAERDGSLEDSSYMDSLPKDNPVKRNENVFSFSMHLASLEIQHFLSLLLSPSGVKKLPPFIYHFKNAELEKFPSIKCNPKCLFIDDEYYGHGNSTDLSFIGKHEVAEQKRLLMKSSEKKLLRHFIKKVISNVVQFISQLFKLE